MNVRHAGIQNFTKLEEWIISLFWDKKTFDATSSLSILLVVEYFKMDATSSSEMSVVNHQSVRRLIPEGCIFFVYSCHSHGSNLARSFVQICLCVSVVHD